MYLFSIPPLACSSNHRKGEEKIIIEEMAGNKRDAA
jgi:hypothetical protein